MKLLMVLTILSLLIAASFTGYGQTSSSRSSLTSKLGDAQRRLPMSRIQVDELDRYYDSQFIGRRVQRLETINMQMQGRIMFLENLIADMSLDGGFQAQQMWTCSIQGQFVGTQHTRVGAAAIARSRCSEQKTIRCNVSPSCEKHLI